MAEVAPINWNSSWDQAIYNPPQPARRLEWGPVGDRAGQFFGAAGTQVLRTFDEGKLKELLLGMGVGFAVKNGFQLGLLAVGVQGYPVTILAGAATGATVSFVKEYRQVGGFSGIDYGCVGRGALIGAIGGLTGGLLRDFWDHSYLADHNPITWAVGAVGETLNRFGTGVHDTLGKPVTLWDGGWHVPGLTPPEHLNPPSPTATPESATPQPTAVPKPATPVPGATPQPVPTPSPETMPTPGLDLDAKITDFGNNHDLQEAVAARVGYHLLEVPESSPYYAQAQKVLETQGYNSIHNTLRQLLIDHPNLDINNNLADLQFAKDAAQFTFDQDYTNAHLEDAVQSWAHGATVPTRVEIVTAVDTHQAAAQIDQFVADNHTNPDFFTPHTVVSGETAGHLLQEMNINPTWDGSDVYGFSALAVSNPGAFSDIASGIGLNTEDFLKLLQQAQNDSSAARKVYQAMSLIKSGTHLNLPTKALLEQVRQDLQRKLAYAG